MKTGNAGPVKHTGGGGSEPVSGGAGPLGGEGVGPLGGEGVGPIGGEPVDGGPRAKAILQQIAKHFGHLSKAFDDLANTPFGGVPSPKGTAKKK
jgi:hypothetical protein